MDAAAVLARLENLGVSVEVADDKLRLTPGSRVPPDLIDELRAHKQEIILKLRGYRLKYQHPEAKDQELHEIAARADSEGYVLLWSHFLCDSIAFYRDDEARMKIPPGFVPYSVAELRLFANSAPPMSDHVRRLIHEAKKHGGIVTERRTHDEPGEWVRDDDTP